MGDEELTSEIDTPAAHRPTLPLPWVAVDDESPIFEDADNNPDRWLADQRSADAIAERGRVWGLAQQQRELATFVGLCVDLAEHGQLVVVLAAGERMHRGRITSVGRDMIALATSAGATLIRTESIRWLRPEPGFETLPSGDRRDSGADLLTALGDLFAARATVTIGLEGSSEMVRGELVSVGSDVVSVRRGPDLVHLGLQSISEVVAVSG
jgi:hypothetical protein